MVIQLPKDIEARLNDLAERQGRPPEELATAAIAAMLLRSEPTGDWPRPKAVGIVRDGGLDLEHLDEWMAENRPVGW